MDNSFRKQLIGYWDIIRPVDGMVMGIGLNVGMVLAGSIELGIPLIFYFLVFLAGFFVTSHAMVINDIIDIEIDKINEPERVLPKGILSKRQAFVYAIFLAVIGIFFFVMIDLGGYDRIPYLWLYGLIHVLLADFYNYRLKETGIIGNIVVAESSYALFLGADIFLNGMLTFVPQVMGIMAFCASLSREIYKGIIDQEGDEEHGIKTIAVVFGPRFAKYLATAIFSISVVMLIITFPRLELIGQLGLIITGLLFMYIIYLAKDAEIPQRSRKIKTLILIGPLLLSPFIIVDRLLPITSIFY